MDIYKNRHLISSIITLIITLVFIINTLVFMDNLDEPSKEEKQVTLKDVEISPEYDAKIEKIINDIKSNNANVTVPLFANMVRDYVFAYQNKIDYLISKLNPDTQKEYKENYIERVENNVNKVYIYTLIPFAADDNKDTSNNKYNYEKICIECIQDSIDELKKQERALSKIVKEQGNLN